MTSQDGNKKSNQGGERDDVIYYDNGEKVTVACETTAGSFKVELHKDWSPNGYKRAVELFDRGFYDNSHFFRVVPHFLVQFGISYTQDKDLRKLGHTTIQDDPQLKPRMKFQEGTVSFAGSGPNSRSSHLFVAYGASDNFGTELWETPIGIVVEGMDNLKKLNSDYGDMPPWGHGPEQHKINSLGENYITQEFPKLDKFLTCVVLRDREVEVKVEEEEENGNLDIDIDHGDDFVKVESKIEEDVGIVNELSSNESLLRKTALKENDGPTSHGFEVPIMIIAAILIFIGIGIRRRKINKMSKSM